MNDITILYYTSNTIPSHFAESVRARLLESSQFHYPHIPIVSISQKPMDFGENVCVDEIGKSTLNLYRQVLIGARFARTPYVALCEDDCLYLPTHFYCHRPALDTFAYNQNKWTVFAWDRPDKAILSNKLHRCVLNQCIAPRLQLISALEERFALREAGGLPDEQVRMHFAEPGRYEKWMGVSIQKMEEFSSPQPSIVFCHLHAMDYLGKRKRHGDIRVESCEPWGTAVEIIEKYIGKEEWERQQRA